MRIKITSVILAFCFGMMLLAACDKKIDVDSLTPEQAHALTKEQLKSLSAEDRSKVQWKAAFYSDPNFEKGLKENSEKPLPR